MTRHVRRLTDPERDDLGEMFHYMLLAQGDNKNGQTPSFKQIRVPMTNLEFKQFCLSNRNSIMKGLPLPRMFKINKHSCISLIDKLDHLIAHGIFAGLL